MARRRTLYRNDMAARFRQIVRPVMFGRIGMLEPILTSRMAMAMQEWFNELITRVMADTDINDEKLEVQRQLRAGLKIICRTSMKSLSGRIDVYPWIFPHEYGGTLRPQSSRALTIPIYHGLRPDGRPKFRSANSWRRYGSFIYTPKNSERSYIAYKNADGKLLILYVLVDEVEIPARLGLNRMADRMLGELLVEWQYIFVTLVGGNLISNLWTEGV